jgi:hypothetical protein
MPNEIPSVDSNRAQDVEPLPNTEDFLCASASLRENIIRVNSGVKNSTPLFLQRIPQQILSSSE